MNKILQLLEFVNEAKSSAQITERFGHGTSKNMSRLIKQGSVRVFRGFNEESENKFSRNIVNFYVATGKPYAPRFPEPSPRKEYYRQWYEKRKAQKDSN